MIRLGLIGAGKWGKNYIAAAKEAEKDVGPIDLFQVQGDQRQWRNMLPVPFDGFIVATPPEPRLKICAAIAELGHPMMVEKPVSLSAAEVDWFKFILNPKVLFLVDYVHLFAPAYEALRMLVRERLGRVRVYGRTSCEVERSYSPLWDHGCHDLAMCLGLGLEKPVHVSGAKVDGHQDMDVQFDSGDAAHIRVSRGPKNKQLIVMCGSLGAVYDASGTLRVNGQPVEVSTERPLTRAVRAFAQAVKDGGTDDWRFGIESSVEITQMLEQVHGSLAQP